MGYYPTPQGVVELLKPLFVFPTYGEKTCALDLFCREGATLESLAMGKNAETFDIELDAACAREAKFLNGRPCCLHWE